MRVRSSNRGVRAKDLRGHDPQMATTKGEGDLVLPLTQLYLTLSRVESGIGEYRIAAISLLGIEDDLPIVGSSETLLESRAFRDATDFDGVHELLVAWAERHGRFRVELFSAMSVPRELIDVWQKMIDRVAKIYEDIFEQQEGEAQWQTSAPRDPFWLALVRAPTSEPELARRFGWFIGGWVMIVFSVIPVLNLATLPIAILLFWPGYRSREMSDLPGWAVSHFRHGAMFSIVCFFVGWTIVVIIGVAGHQGPGSTPVWVPVTLLVLIFWIFLRMSVAFARWRLRQEPKFFSIFG